MRLGLNARFLAAPATGVQRFAREMTARLLGLAGDDDAVLLLPRGAVIPAAMPAEVRTVHGRLAGHAWEQLELPRRARSAGCDVVLNPANTAPVRGGPHVVVVHDTLALTRPEWFGRAFRVAYRYTQRRAARRAAAIVTVSEWARRATAAALGVAAERIAVVGQGTAPFDRPADVAEIERVRTRHALPHRYLLALGDGDPRKNIAFLYRVRERWQATRGEPPALVLVGSRSPRVHAPARDRDDAPRPVGANGPHDTGVVRLGRVDDDELHALYSGAAAFCFPSHAEGFGRPPLEAMACGAPIIAAPYGAAREVLGDAARIVPLDADAWIAAIEPLLEPGPVREAACEAGRRHAAAFRWDAAAARLLDICRAVAAAGGR